MATNNNNNESIEANSESKFKTLVIFDLETTGLIYDEPKITELAMIAVNVATMQLLKSNEELPRILNKFVKCFDPKKLLHFKAAEVSELNNRILMDYAPFTRQTVMAIVAFLRDFQQPMCFIAHNGNTFDFPIFFNEIQLALSNSSSSYTDRSTDTAGFSSDVSFTCKDDPHALLTSIECADSLIFFREIHRLLNDAEIVQLPNEKNLSVEPLDLSLPITPIPSASSSRLGYIDLPLKYVPSPDPTRQQHVSMKLSKIYEREVGPLSKFQAHRAEDDCLMLLALLKLYLPDWLDWIEIHTRPLSDFSPMPSAFVQNSPKNVIKVKRPLKF